jgi:nucleotide-binding universal stress UspA family protein
MDTCPTRVVVGACGHPHADAALEYAAGYAARRQGEIVAVHVTPPPPPWAFWDLGGVLAEWSAQDRQAAFDRADRVLRRGRPWRFRTASGPVAQCLARVARDERAALVVLGARAGENPPRWPRLSARGRVARALAGCGTPVIQIPERLPAGGPLHVLHSGRVR